MAYPAVIPLGGILLSHFFRIWLWISIAEVFFRLLSFVVSLRFVVVDSRARLVLALRQPGPPSQLIWLCRLMGLHMRVFRYMYRPDGVLASVCVCLDVKAYFYLTSFEYTLQLLCKVRPLYSTVQSTVRAPGVVSPCE